MSLNLASAEKQYEKDIFLKREDVEVLFHWLKKQPHLPQLTELQIILFLHSCYFRIEAAKKAIENYFTTRSNYPEYFHCPSEKILRHNLSSEFISVLPKLTNEGYIILVMKLLDFKPENYICVNSLRMATMVLSLYLHQYGPANGFVLIVDIKGATMSHFAKANLMAIKQVLFLGQEAMPIRIKSVHCVNVVPLAEKILALIRPFTKSEIFRLIKLHSNFDTLYEFLPKECLPKEYGGQLASVKVLQEENGKNLFSNLDFFKWHDSQKVDESKRLEKTQSCPNFGIEGTFKKLEID